MSIMQESHFVTAADEGERLKAAWSQLGLVLGFFSRIDTKLAVVLGIDLGMLAMLATHLPKMGEITVFILAAGVLFAGALTVSFYHLWNGAFPHLEGGTNSLVYFQSIAGMTESGYRTAYSALSMSELADDLLNQVWRNSKILTSKFRSLRRAYASMLLATLPWLLLLTLLPATKTAASLMAAFLS